MGLFNHGSSTPTRPAAKLSAPSNHNVTTTTAAVNTKPDHLHPQPLSLEPVHEPVVALPGVGEESVGPLELGGQDRQSDEHDRPTGSGVRNGDDPESEHRQADDPDGDAVGEVRRLPLPQPVPPSSPIDAWRR